MATSPELDGASIVALGSFNPAIFHPLWFSKSGLMREEESGKANVVIIHRDAAIFTTEWLKLQVTSDRFAIETFDPTLHNSLRDLMLGTFRLLEHTPILAFGLNRMMNFRASDEGYWHAIGDRLVPKRTWAPFFKRPGLRTLVIEGERPGCDADRLQVKVAPLEQSHHGVAIHVNEHYNLLTDKYPTPLDRSLKLATALQSAWDPFRAYAESASRMVFELPNNPEPST